MHVSQDDLVQQRDLALQIVRGMKSSSDAFEKVAALHAALTERKKATKAPDKLDALEKKVESLQKGTKRWPGFGPINRDLGRLISSVESADIRPSQAVRAAVQQLCDQLDKNLQQFQNVNNQDVPALNIKSAGTTLPKSGCGE